MTTQRKKLEGNGLWESSRMMLPEHIVRIREFNHDLLAKEKPVLDADELEVLERVVSASLSERTPITLRLYNRFEDLNVIGVVERIDTLKQRVMVDGEWIQMADILGATPIREE
ncbi:YolD-like family protein [Paenibacillus luteus]|uniref:YolD-like family protein n=1 Tax=Paenibacillus luteus TaxID=2545753 RepID=UPI001144FA02|nr:YolD-like family protein [Paenibacillus luteus]